MRPAPTRKTKTKLLIFNGDKRRKFGRVYTNEGKAKKFVIRQRRSPVVESTRIEKLD